MSSTIALWLIAAVLIGIFGALNRIAKALIEMGKLKAASMSKEAAEIYLKHDEGKRK